MDINWLELVFEIGVFLSVSYFLFYKTFIKTLAKQQAKLVTLEQLTSLEENVKQGFKKELEDYRHELTKNNIAFQISLAEVTKQRLYRIEELIQNLLVLQFYVMRQIYTAESEEDLNDYSEYYRPVVVSSKICALYLNRDLNARISDLIQTVHDSLAYFKDVHEHLTNPAKQNIDFSESKRLMNTALDMFPSLLNTLTSEFQKQVILKDLDK